MTVWEESLEMVRGSCPVALPDVLSGYLLRTALPGDASAYDDLFTASYPEFGDRDLFGLLTEKSVPGGFFVAESLETGEMVASAAAAIFPRERHPEGASLQWLMVHPEHRGKGLGMLVSAAATKRLADLGFRRSYLLTQDPRVAAIAIYFKLGWRPSLYQDEMHDRWRAVCRRLERDVTPGEWPAMET